MKLFAVLLFIIGSIATISMLTIDVSDKAYSWLSSIAFASALLIGALIVIKNIFIK